MSEEQLKAFLEKVKGDTGLQDKLKSATGPDAVVVIAKEAGFTISLEEIENNRTKQLSDKELEGVVGGATLLHLHSCWIRCGND